MLRLSRFGKQATGTLLAFLLVQIIVFAKTPDETDLSKWENFDFSKKSIELKEIKNLHLEDLRLLRGIVFGKRGRIFKDRDIADYLKTRSWYKPNKNFQNSLLNDIESKNIDVIREAESLQHSYIEPGDLRFWQTKLMTEEQLGYHTAAEWKIILAEVEAIHGRMFVDEPWLQKYFEERYWYKADANYSPKVLSETERKNIQTINAARNKERKVAVSPGEMDLFQNALLTEQMLKGLTIHELRLMRNEFFARHGHIFKQEWLARYFKNTGYDWYEPVSPDKESTLSETEEQNVKLIQTYENKLREQLLTKVIKSEELDGLFAEDAKILRNEIFARHGKVFKDKELKDYFSSFDWYKPDPKFKETSLNKTEKKNVATIYTYEKEAVSKFAIIEG